MNVVTFNDPFLEALEKHSLVDKEITNAWKTAPLFDVELPETVAIENADITMREWSENSKDGLPEIMTDPWPFPFLRVSLSVKGVNRDESERHPIWMNEVKAMRCIHVIAAQDSVGQSVMLFRPTDKELRADPPVFLFHLASDGSMCFDGIYMHKLGGWATPNQWYLRMTAREYVDKDKFRMMTGRLIASVFIMFTAFLASAMSPQNHMVTVTPNQPHRSVQWLQARTHYTIISHGHPANRPMTSGARVTVNQEAELQRMAHNRRAHYRTLRSERFRYARGKRIFVRATWVGPKEWKDAGGKQIYHILEESKWTPNDKINQNVSTNGKDVNVGT